MSAPRGLIRVRQDAQGITVQVVGWGRMQQSMPVRRLGESCLAEGSGLFRVDLRHCSYLDSTFLGTLLYLQRAARKLGKGQVVLISPSPECCRLFKQIGVEDCFAVACVDEFPAEDWRELSCPSDDVEAFNQNVIQAHEELANVGGPAGDKFQAVIRCLHGDRSS